MHDRPTFPPNHETDKAITTSKTGMHASVPPSTREGKMYEQRAESSAKIAVPVRTPGHVDAVNPIPVFPRTSKRSLEATTIHRHVFQFYSLP